MKLFGENRYISQKLAEYLWNDGIEAIYKRRKNMKEMNPSDTDKISLRKKALVESVNDVLKAFAPFNMPIILQGFFNNANSALIGYLTFDKKPSI